jgi:hypothetical protein
MFEKFNALQEKPVEYGIIAAFVLSSLAYAMMLPAYEGFDETAHYSYISYLAQTGKIPDFTIAKLDANVEEDQKVIPKPYGVSPPYENNDGINYYQFFNNLPAEDRVLAHQRLWVKGTAGTHYKEGTGLNWQGQHPPLYYTAMLPPYFLSKDWPTGYRLMFLRVCSLAFVWIGLYAWIRAVRRFDSHETRVFILSGMTALLFFPSLYFDLARIGNDSMAAMLAALCFYFITAMRVSGRDKYKNTIYLSITIGFGLLTKMLFVPIMAACLAFLIFTSVSNRLEIKPLLIRLFTLILVPLAISGWWFNLFHARYGMYLGSEEFYALGRMGTASVNLSPFGYVKQAANSVASFTKTFLWCGSWSWLKLPYWFYVVFAPFPPLLAYKIIFGWKKVSGDIRQLTIAAGLIIAALLAGFAHHMATRIAFTGIGTGTSGYYLFIVWPFLAVILSYAFVETKSGAVSVVLPVCFGLLLLFEMEGFWREMLLYGGIWRKYGTDAFGAGYIPPSFSNIQFAMERHQQLAFSFTAAALFIVSVPLKLSVAVYLLLRGALRPMPK